MLVTLEGIDGSGKTTVWKSLHDRHPDAVFTREPTDSWYGDAVRKSLSSEDADPLAELFLYTADHAAHLASVVRPALEAGRLVISDRYSDSRFAYQGATLDGLLDRPMAYVREVHRPWTLPPDLTIYLDVDPETGSRRSGSNDKFERATHLDAVRTNYERLLTAEPERFVRVDASRSPDTVLEEVVRAIDHATND